MKKLFIILIMFMYGVSASGMTIRLHYCCGKLDDISFFSRHSQDCKMGEEIKMSSCCNDQQISVKVNPDQEPLSKSVQLQKVFLAAALSQPAIPVNFRQFLRANNSTGEKPPPLRPVPLFIKNCVFRV